MSGSVIGAQPPIGCPLVPYCVMCIPTSDQRPTTSTIHRKATISQHRQISLEAYGISYEQCKYMRHSEIINSLRHANDECIDSLHGDIMAQISILKLNEFESKLSIKGMVHRSITHILQRKGLSDPSRRLLFKYNRLLKTEQRIQFYGDEIIRSQLQDMLQIVETKFPENVVTVRKHSMNSCLQSRFHHK